MPIIRKYIYIILIGTLLGLSSCHSSRKAASGSDIYPQSRSEMSPKDLSKELAALSDTYYQWSDVQAPVKIQLLRPKRTSLSGVAKMIQGENIHVSIRVFGFEVGSLYADKEIVQVYIKAMDMYWAEPLSVLTERYGLTINDIQSLLLGQPFMPGTGTLSSRDLPGFKIENTISDSENKTTFAFSPKKLPEGISWSYTAESLPDSAPYLTTMSITPEFTGAIDCAFASPTVSPAGSVSPAIECGMKLNNTEIQGSWIWTFENAKWNSGLTVSRPMVSKSARKVETSQLLKMLKSL